LADLPATGKSEIRISKLETNLKEESQMNKTQKPILWLNLVLNFENWGFDIVSDFGFRYSGFRYYHDSESPESAAELMRW